MKYKKKRIIIGTLVLAGIFLIVVSMYIINYANKINHKVMYEDNPHFEGKGTKENPYFIRNSNELKQFRDNVNGGEKYDGVYFKQTCNIDLAGEEWTPIGVFGSGNYFFGTYDGGAYKIQNLVITDSGESLNNGFFGQLGGTVMNLGIESGYISGAYVGSIASHSTGDKAFIVNCYNKATIIGTGRAGGIADNFSGGVIVNCVNAGAVSAPKKAGIVSYNASALINVSSAGTELLYPETSFTGEWLRTIDVDDFESAFDYLNSGVESLGTLNISEYSLLQCWVEEFAEESWKNPLLENPLSGSGAMEDPYLISSVEDLKWFRDSVNSGKRYENVYFEQTCDIDLKGEEWEPIGVFGSNNYFYGTYNGGNHKIENLVITISDGNNGFFGQLGGVVINLGIESGLIQGNCIGSIASHAVGEEALIINCYNKAALEGKIRAGGICDNFKCGMVVNCANVGLVNAPRSAGIVSYDAKYIINAYSEDAMYRDETFTGEQLQYSEVSETNDVIEFLNHGLNFVGHDLLQPWTEK